MYQPEVEQQQAQREKEKRFEKAKYYLLLGEYDDASTIIRNVFNDLGELGATLTDEQAKVVVSCFKGSAESRRKKLRSLEIFGQMVKDDDRRKELKKEAVNECVQGYQNMLFSVCNTSIKMLNETLFPFATTPYQRVLYCATVADFWRYKIDCQRGEDINSIIEQAYQEARNLAESLGIGPADQLRLSIGLNFAIFMSDVKKDKAKALEIGTRVRDLAINRMEMPFFKPTEEALNVLEILEGNIRKWSS
ncbi:hypothetical protein niasHT_029910 [Heterodera trifolii]|uniref:14-3-3 domain-containing protein n=1 Tax=Heterodera trifolii TaxID=157864 RepID=A0ABD2KBZ9_9BILA